VFSRPIFKRNIKKPALLILLILAAWAFFSLSWAASNSAEKQWGGVIQFRLSGYALNTAAMQNILDKRDGSREDVRYTAWTEQKSVVIENCALGLKGSFEKALCYFGDNQGIFNIISDKGCALSPDTAFKVFGTTRGILGENVLINGELYAVERLLYDEAASVVYKVNKDNTGVDFDVLNVIPGKGSGVSASEIVMNHNIRSDLVIYYREVIEFFSLSFYIPDSFIPTRWSEFEFWSNTFTNYGNAVKYYFSMKTYAPDTVFRSYMLKTVIFAALFAAALIAFLICAFKIVRERGIKVGVNYIKKCFKKIRQFGNRSGK